MTDFLQLFFSGLATGSIYALAALGFTLLWQASGTINFAQGEFDIVLDPTSPLHVDFKPEQLNQIYRQTPHVLVKAPPPTPVVPAASNED